ncbi:hypothetical protein POTOM_034560 [Populus tomentosa]|uniref:Uncharacterized protein n=1 Tax=Populus tomentosa TaxID=118781 RepID=A0A8X8CP57_POPTO|nr:hypothetical protein POTOM_034560 [Populus tomentosa]
MTEDEGWVLLQLATKKDWWNPSLMEDNSGEGPTPLKMLLSFQDMEILHNEVLSVDVKRSFLFSSSVHVDVEIFVCTLFSVNGSEVNQRSFPAAIAEMLVESTAEDLYLLLALPQDKWADGCVKD